MGQPCWRNVSRTEGLKGLNHHSAQVPGGGHISRGGVLQSNTHRTRPNRAANAIGQIHDSGGYLFREPEKVCCIRSGGLDPNVVLADDRFYDAVDGRPKNPENVVMARFVVKTPRQTPEF